MIAQTRSAANDSAAARCLRDAQSRMPAFIAAALDRGMRQMAFRSVLSVDVARSSAAREAGATLYKLRGSIAKVFMREVARAFECDRDDGPAGATSPSQDICLDICLDDGLGERLDAAHLGDAAERACTAERVEFDALFSAAAGSFVVQADHALSPAVMAGCLGTALREWPVRFAVRDAWFTYLGEPFGIELAQLYRALSRGLRQAGVREAEFVPPMVGGRRFESWRSAS